ncbi:homeodomain-like protein [Tanacetum coccineum]|uniref:Homeodomain-like protein n=1 Tax=Tanacetum coccineum TaxID=301880 RepID=A0ABQ5HHF5_9ASTR
MAIPFANPKRQFQARRGTSPTPIHNIYTFYESESSESESEDIGEIDIKTLTLEQYRNVNNTQNRKNNPEKTTFEIKGQFLRELHKITFSGCSTENAIEHIRKILEVASLFNTDDSALLQVFPLTLIGVAKRWFDRTPAIILEQLGEILNFKQEQENHYLTLGEDITTSSLNAHFTILTIIKNEGETIYNTSINTRCSDVLQNELPPKEKDPGSFILPCAIGTTTLSNALADLGASMSIMPFSLFKRLGLGNPKPINMVIEMADRSMQSPMGIVENVLVKINKFIFPVDFIILDIIEDNKVLIILGRPMLATAHARIDVFGKKISLKVGTEQITFDINKKESSAVTSLVCVINSFLEINKLYKPRDLEELLLSNDDLDIFPNDNDLLPNLEGHDNILLSPTGSTRFNNDSSEIFRNPNSNSSITIDDFVNMDDVWDKLDYRDLTYEGTKSPVKPEFLSSSNRIHLHSPYNLQITCKIGFINFDPYIKPQSPFNIMSRKAYNSIMKHELEFTGNNMVGITRNLHVFIGSH